MHLAAVDADALADAHEPVAVPVRRHGADAVVGDLELELVRPVADGHVGPARVPVLEGVGQTLLHDAVGREVDRPRQRERFAVYVKLTGSPARPTSPISESSASRPGWGASSTPSPSLRIAPSRRRISASAVRPACSTLASASLSSVAALRELVPDGADLEHHHAHGVGDDVVKLARDPRALLGHGDPRRRLALPLGEYGAHLRRLPLPLGEARPRFRRLGLVRARRRATRRSSRRDSAAGRRR